MLMHGCGGPKVRIQKYPMLFPTVFLPTDSAVPVTDVISDVGIPSLFIEKASLPTQRSGRCSSVVELGTCHLRPRFNSLRADFCLSNYFSRLAPSASGATGAGCDI